MPGRLKVRILGGRDFPIMDRASELTDAFVEVRFAGDTFKTEVCKKSLNPQWNSEWFKFEAEDEVLQDEPLDLKVLDYDTYSAHDAIGKVYIDVKPLLSREAPYIISGWFPIYDTMHGIRGELNVQVRVELFTDFNKFRQSSCGIQFFCTCEVPAGWYIQEMLGFVEELVVNDDPEYQWIDKIRTPRASNEARQRLFSKLSGELQRKLGVKVLEMGGDAVLGYHQNFDLEGESGIVVRAIGTAVSLTHSSIDKTLPLLPGHISPVAVSPAKDHHYNHQPYYHHYHQQHHSHHGHNKYHKRHYHHQHHHHHHHSKNSNGSHSQHHINRASSSEYQTKHLESQPIRITHQNPKVSPSSSNQSDEPTSIPKESYSSPSSPPPSAPPVLRQSSFGSRLMGSSPPKYFRFSYSFVEDDPSFTQQFQLITDSMATIPAGSSPSPSPNQVSQNQHRHSTSPVRNIGLSNISTTSNHRLSEPDVGSPKVGSFASSDGSGPAISTIVSLTRTSHHKSSVLQQSIDMVEYPFFTMRSFPVGFIVSLGGVVSSRSVKLLDKIHNPEEPETRDAWWSEIRTEIKSHASKLSCHAVLGYQEQTTICDDVIILSAMGTAAKVNLDFHNNPKHMGGLSTPVVPSGSAQVMVSPTSSSSGTERSANRDVGGVSSGGGSGNPSGGGGGGSGGAGSGGGGGGSSGEGDKSKDHHHSSKERHLFVDIGLANQAQAKSLGLIESGIEMESFSQCSLCHIPYNANSLPFDVQLSKCAICRKHFVPEVLFTTVDPPEEMPIWSRGSLIQARLYRAKTKNKNSEQSAREVSDSLPFLEYEVHNQLINKLKIRGLNCLFGLKIQISIGENLMTAVATATGTFLGPLPAPPMPRISSQGATARESEEMVMLQKKITQTVQKHRDRLMMKGGDVPLDHSPIQTRFVEDDSDEDVEETDILLEKTRDKNTFVLVVDDVKDESVPIMLEDWVPPDGFEICNTQRPPGIPADKIDRNVQMFTEMVRVHFNPTTNSGLDFAKIFDTVLRRLCFKLRHFKPCSFTDICFNIDLPDEDKVNVAVTGCVLSLHDMSIAGPTPGPTPVPTPSITTASSITSNVRSSRGAKLEHNKRNSAHLSQSDDMMFSLDGISDPTSHHTQSAPATATTTTTTTITTTSNAAATATHTSTGTTPPSTSNSSASTSTTCPARQSMKLTREVTKKKEKEKGVEPTRGIELTPLNVIHDGTISQYLGYYNFFFIRESTAVRENGGIGGFVQSFLAEVLSIVRAHVKALGGNGLMAFHMAHFILDNNPHKNQGQCLINVSGDMVTVARYDDDRNNTSGDHSAGFNVSESASNPVPSSSST